MLDRARLAHDAGQFAAATKIAVEALTCNRSSRTYNFAVQYACDSKNEKLARGLAPELNDQQLAAAKKRCQLHGITLVP